MSFFGFIFDFVDGNKGTNCCHEGCHRVQFQTSGFCFDHGQAMIRNGNFGVLDLNRQRFLRGKPAVASHEAARPKRPAPRPRPAPKPAGRYADVDPRERFRAMEESLGVRPGSLYSMAEDEDFGEE